MVSDAKRDRQQRVLAAAKEIISKQGCDFLEMKELAQITGVPRASLYRTYASKEHIISDITLEWGLSFAGRLQASSPTGRTNGERIKKVFKSILQEAEDNPLLIGAVLRNILSADDSTRKMQIEFEGLLPAALSSAVDYSAIPDPKKVMGVLVRLLLVNLQMLSSGRSSLKESLSHMVFAAERLTGEGFWNG